MLFPLRFSFGLVAPVQYHLKITEGAGRVKRKRLSYNPIFPTIPIPTLFQQLSCLSNNGPDFGETGSNHTIKW